MRRAGPACDGAHGDINPGSKKLLRMGEGHEDTVLEFQELGSDALGVCRLEPPNGGPQSFVEYYSPLVRLGGSQCCVT